MRYLSVWQELYIAGNQGICYIVCFKVVLTCVVDQICVAALLACTFKANHCSLSRYESGHRCSTHTSLKHWGHTLSKHTRLKQSGQTLLKQGDCTLSTHILKQSDCTLSRSLAVCAAISASTSSCRDAGDTLLARLNAQQASCLLHICAALCSGNLAFTLW